MSNALVRRTTRVSRPALTPDEAMVPLVHRGTTTNRVGERLPEDSPDDSFEPIVQNALSNQGQDVIVLDSDTEEPVQAQDVIDLDQTDTEERRLVFEESEVDDYAATNRRFRQLLGEAAAVGENFDKDAVIDENPVTSTSSGVTQTDQAAGPGNSKPDDTSGTMEDINQGDESMTGVEPEAIQPEDDAPAAVVIGLEKAKDDFSMEVAVMNVGSRPTVAKVLRCLKDLQIPKMRVLYRRLQQIPVEDWVLSTSMRPVAMKDLGLERGALGNARPEIIGSLADADNISLEQCMPCIETDNIRRSVTPPIPSAMPVMVLYIQCLNLSPPHASVGAIPSDTSISRSNLLPRSAPPPLDTMLMKYLDKAIEHKYVAAYQRLCHLQRPIDKAFTAMILARLVEDVCRDLSITYSGNNKGYKVDMMNGAHVSLEDIILFFGQKSPEGSRASQTLPSTFSNHRTIYMRAQGCLGSPETEREKLTGDDQAFMKLLQNLLNTELSALHTLNSGNYGRLEDFKNKVSTLYKKLYPKGQKKQSAASTDAE